MYDLSQRDWDRILALSPDLIGIAGMDGHFKYLSPMCEHILGYSNEELMARPFLDLVHPDDRDRAEGEIACLVAGSATHDFELRGVRKDGTTVHTLWAATAVADEGLIYFIGQDITKRKKATRELEKSEERFRHLMEQSPLGIAILKPDGQLAQVNSAWMQAWGFNESETARVMAEYNMLTDPQLEQLGVMPLVEKAFAGDPVVLPPFEYSGDRALAEMGLEDMEAKTIWIHIHLYAIKDEQGEVEYVVGINQDITAQKKSEEEARLHQEALARVERASRMGQLTGSIAHELNQPLTGILSNAQAAELMLENGQWVPEEGAGIMAEIAADAKRAGEIIRNLRELYSEQKTEFSPFDINAAVAAAARLFRSESVKQGLVLTATCAPTIPMVRANKVQLEQVLVNLVMNGIEAMNVLSGAGRRLHIETAHDGNEVKVWVEDSGPGIDPDKIDRIFDPLATWKPGGMGMGLALSHSIIQTHGGRMWAENKPEGGAHVGFALPIEVSGSRVPAFAKATADKQGSEVEDRNSALNTEAPTEPEPRTLNP